MLLNAWVSFCFSILIVNSHLWQKLRHLDSSVLQVVALYSFEIQNTTLLSMLSLVKSLHDIYDISFFTVKITAYIGNQPSYHSFSLYSSVRPDVLIPIHFPVAISSSTRLPTRIHDSSQDVPLTITCYVLVYMIHYWC